MTRLILACVSRIECRTRFSIRTFSIEPNDKAIVIQQTQRSIEGLFRTGFVVNRRYEFDGLASVVAVSCETHDSVRAGVHPGRLILLCRVIVTPYPDALCWQAHKHTRVFFEQEAAILD